MGCTPRTAKRGWEVGWTHEKRKGWAVAISKIHAANEEEKRIAEERLVQRRAEEMAAARIKELEQAKRIAEEQAKKATEESQIEGNVRAAVQRATMGAAQVIAAASAFSQRLMFQIFEATTRPDGVQVLTQPLRMRADAPAMAPHMVGRFMKDAMLLARYGAEAAKLSLEVARMREGKPVAVLGLQMISDMSDEEVASQLLQISRAGMLLTQGAQAVDQHNEYTPEGDDYDPPEEATEGPTPTT